MVHKSTLPLLGRLIVIFQMNSESKRMATVELCDATRELQCAAWKWVSLHSTSGTAWTSSDLAQEEKILKKFGSAVDIFAQDHVLPSSLALLVHKESSRIKQNLTHLRTLSSRTSLSQTALEIQRACERIRRAASPHLELLSA